MRGSALALLALFSTTLLADVSLQPSTTHGADPLERPAVPLQDAAKPQVPPRAAKPSPAPPAPAPEPAGPAIAIVNARILPVSGPAIEHGTLVMRGGRITAVGGNVQPPAGARVIDAAGKTVTPGLIDSATQIGIVEIPLSAQGTADQRTTDPRVSAAFTVVDAFNGNSTVIPVTRVEGSPGPS